ncbi:hypothetical protein JCM11641_007342 [Rhodosporidiobolus odoratus]
MLDRLPVELLSLVLHLATPLDCTPSFYQERRATLRSCSLVSKEMRQLAQPMLPEVFAAEVDEDVKVLNVRLGNTRRGSGVKLLVLLGEQDLLSRNSYDDLLGICPMIVELRFVRVDGIDLSWLRLSARLAHLIISAGTLRHNKPGPIPSLSKLSICATQPYDDGILEHLLLPEITPKLRAFGMSSVVDPFTFDSLPLPKFPSALTERLAVLSVDILDSHVEEAVSSVRPGALLVDCAISNLRYMREPLYPALRLYSFTDEPVIEAALDVEADHLSDFTARLRLDQARYLELLILPAALRAAPTVTSSFGRALESLVRLCESVGVEVVWEEEGDWQYQSLISPFFWRRAESGMRQNVGEEGQQ